MHKTIITLDVGGRIFKCNKQTLIDRSEYFKYLFEDNPSLKDDEEIYIDRSGYIYQFVDALIKDRDFKYPPEYETELKYYGIFKNCNSISPSSHSKPPSSRCTNQIVYGIERCKDCDKFYNDILTNNICPVQDCTTKSYHESGGYCFDHICQFQDCTTKSYYESGYCPSHGCGYPNCHNKKDTNRSYCYKHLHLNF